MVLTNSCNVNIPRLHPSVVYLLTRSKDSPAVQLLPGRSVTADPVHPDRSREIVQYRSIIFSLPATVTTS